MHLILEYLYVPYGNLIFGCVAKHSAVRAMRIHPHCVLLSLNSGYVCPYYDLTSSRKYFSLSLIMVLVTSF
jgi:hypothetical protein